MIDFKILKRQPHVKKPERLNQCFSKGTIKRIGGAFLENIQSFLINQNQFALVFIYWGDGNLEITRFQDILHCFLKIKSRFAASHPGNLFQKQFCTKLKIFHIFLKSVKVADFLWDHIQSFGLFPEKKHVNGLWIHGELF